MEEYTGEVVIEAHNFSDGVEYNFFVLEIEIITEEGTRLERYGFREEEGIWIFAQLSVADIA